MPRDRELRYVRLHLLILNPNRFPDREDDPRRFEQTAFCGTGTTDIVSSYGITFIDWEPGKKIVDAHMPVLLT